MFLKISVVHGSSSEANDIDWQLIQPGCPAQNDLALISRTLV